MEDQLISDTPSLESLIEQGLVTHLCTRREGNAPDEAAVLTALCAAVAGDIYRISSLNFVFRVEETDLEGALVGQPFQKWAPLVSDYLLRALNLGPDPRPLYVRALVNGKSTPAPTEQPGDPGEEPEPVEEIAASADFAVEDHLGALESAEDAVQAVSEAEEDAFTRESDDPDAPEASMTPDPGGIETAIARIERAVVGGALAESIAALDQRLSRVESALTALGLQIAEQKSAASANETILDDMTREFRKLPERTARHVAARADGFAPTLLALNGVLQRLETRLEEAPENESVARTLGAIETQLAALAAKAPEEARPADDSGARLAALEEELRRIPERAAAHMTARTTSLVPLHVALSGTLHRLECQIETLLRRTEPETGSEGNLKLQIAEFLSRMERQLGQSRGTPVTLYVPGHETAHQNSQ